MFLLTSVFVLMLVYSCDGQFETTSSPCYCPTCPRQCPDGWVYFQNSCYFFSDGVDVDWTEATHHCALHHASLATVENQAEALFLRDFSKRLFRNDNDQHNNQFWLGGSDENIEGIWTWYTDDTLVTYTDWAPGQPDAWHGHNEDCLVMYGPDGYTWHDAPCSDKQHPLCEIRLDALSSSEIIG